MLTCTPDFTPWMKPRQYEQYHLPRRIQKLQGATHVIFGDAVISTPDTCIGVETCVSLEPFLVRDSLV